MSSFRTQNNTTVTIDKAGNEFIGAKCINPTRNVNAPIGSMLRYETLTPLPQVTGYVPHKIVNGEFVRV